MTLNKTYNDNDRSHSTINIKDTFESDLHKNNNNISNDSSRKTIYELIYNELKTKNDNNGAENGGTGDGKCTNGSNNFDINNETIKMIESLCELFPMFTIDELRDHPTNVDHSQDLVTELFDEATALIQSETEKEKKEKDLLLQQSKQYITNVGTPIYLDAVYELQAMFPFIAIKSVEKILQQNNNSIEDAAIALLELSSETTTTTTTGTTRIPQKPGANNNNEWVEESPIVVKVCRFLQSSSNDVYIDKGDVLHYARKNGGDYYKTLYDVVMNCKSMTMSKQQPCHSNPTKTHIQKNSRKVQRGGARGLGGGNRILQDKETQRETSINGNDAKPIPIPSNYRYDEHSMEAKELWSLVPVNSKYSNRMGSIPNQKFPINEVFAIKALEFFQGDVYKVVELISELSSSPISSNKQSKQFNEKRQPFDVKINKPSSPSSTLEYQSDNVSFNSDDEQQLFNKYLKTGTVDFHGFTVVEAMKLVPLILNHWWNQELIHRQSIGQLQKFGNSASLGSVLIITGRGIHSTGGVSTIKASVNRYLINNNYIFNQPTSGSFEITGKRMNNKK